MMEASSALYLYHHTNSNYRKDWLTGAHSY